MTKEEALKIEESIEEIDGETRTYEYGGECVEKIIWFKPKIMLRHSGQPQHAFDRRRELANYLRRIAAYLEA